MWKQSTVTGVGVVVWGDSGDNAQIGGGEVTEGQGGADAEA